MQNQYTALVKNDGNWWIGWIEEIPGVNCQEKSHEDLLQSLRATLREAIECNPMNAIEAAGTGHKEEILSIRYVPDNTPWQN